MKKIINGFILALLSLTPQLILSMDTNVANALPPIVKKEKAVAAPEGITTFIEGILREAHLDPAKYRILAYNDPSDFAGADANSIHNIIRINQHSFMRDSIDWNNPNDWYQIYACYHEVGHLIDRSMQKQRIIGAPISAICSSLLVGLVGYTLTKLRIDLNNNVNRAVWLGGYGAALYSGVLVGHYFMNYFCTYREQAADLWAYRQLIKKKNGLEIILDRLTHLKELTLLNKEKARVECEGHNSEKELQATSQFLIAQGCRWKFTRINKTILRTTLLDSTGKQFVCEKRLK